jgi:predicted ATPase
MSGELKQYKKNLKAIIKLSKLQGKSRGDPAKRFVKTLRTMTRDSKTVYHKKADHTHEFLVFLDSFSDNNIQTVINAEVEVQKLFPRGSFSFDIFDDKKVRTDKKAEITSGFKKLSQS